MGLRTAGNSLVPKSKHHDIMSSRKKTRKIYPFKKEYLP